MNTKAEELRKGNYVITDIGNTILKVTPHDIYDIDNKFFNVSSIPLDQEILEKCGFIDNRIGHHDTCFVLTKDWREQPSFHFGIEYTDSPFPQDKEKVYNISYEVKYLHQLQNLYYILTNSELIVQL